VGAAPDPRNAEAKEAEDEEAVHATKANPEAEAEAEADYVHETRRNQTEEERAAVAREEAIRTAALAREDAIRAAADPSTARGKWAGADWVLTCAFLNSRARQAKPGGWLLAQSLLQLNKRWRATSLCWCEGMETLQLEAGDGWDRCTFGKGVARSILRSSPGVRALHLKGFNGGAFDELELLSKTLEELTVSLSTDVGAMLQTNRFAAMHSLKLASCRDLTPDGLRRVASDSPGLKSLHLRDCELGMAVLAFVRNLPPGGAAALDDFLCTEPLKDEALRAMLRACPKLESLTLHNVVSAAPIKQVGQLSKQLRRLNLRGTDSLSVWADDDVEALAKSCPSLEHLQFQDGGTSPLSGSFIRAFPNLTCLSLRGLRSQISRDGIMTLARPDSRIQHLDVSDSSLEEPAVVEHVLANCAALTHLELARVKGVTSGAFQKIGCSNLRHVGLSGTDIDSLALSPIMASCKHLTHLDVSDTGIDDVALKVIETSAAAPHLINLGVERCEGTSLEALIRAVRSARSLNNRHDIIAYIESIRTRTAAVERFPGTQTSSSVENLVPSLPLHILDPSSTLPPAVTEEQQPSMQSEPNLLESESPPTPGPIVEIEEAQMPDALVRSEECLPYPPGIARMCDICKCEHPPGSLGHFGHRRSFTKPTRPSSAVAPDVDLVEVVAPKMSGDTLDDMYCSDDEELRRISLTLPLPKGLVPTSAPGVEPEDGEAHRSIGQHAVND
jgi:hypothetical protein